MEYLLLVSGLLMLIIGAEVLVKGAVAIALKYRVSMLVIGMTIVSFGTSAPELLVSLKAALSGHQDIGVGTIIGSNISNIALILGFTAVLIPIAVQKDSIKIDWPMMMIATMVFWLFILDRELVFWEGLVMFTSLMIFGIWLIVHSRKTTEGDLMLDEAKQKISNVEFLIRNSLLVAFGCLGLVYGSDFLLDGAVQIARDFDISERVIGVTLVAFGTSLPELITSIVAAYRKKVDISVGNLIGSNLFNILGILGITSMVKELVISQKVMDFDIYWLVGISLLLFPLMFFGRKLSRLKGLILLASYILYIYFVLT